MRTILPSCLLQWISDGGCSDFLYYGKEEKRWLSLDLYGHVPDYLFQRFFWDPSPSKGRSRNVHCEVSALNGRISSSSDDATLHSDE